MPANDAVTHRQAESHPGFIFGREERIEHPQTCLFTHARAGIAQRDFDGVARFFSRHGERAAAGHRVYGIEDEIDQDLAQLRFVTHHGHSDSAIEFHADVDVGGLGAILPTWSRNLADIQQQLSHINQLKIMIATLARKILNSLHRLGAVLCRLDDDVEPLVDFHWIGRFQEQLRAAEYACERVVKIVSHARSEFAECRHLFNLRVLFADSLLLVDVVIQFGDVVFRLFGVRGDLFGFRRGGHHFDVAQVSSVGEVNDGYDRCHRNDRIESGGADELGSNAGRRSSCKERYRSPKIIFRPRVPDRLVHFQRGVDCGQTAIAHVLHQGHRAKRHDQHRRELCVP